jgi:cellulose biosynthesis protein BcsQ
MPTDLISPTARGSIVTFYSYKGGVGRSMALANIAVFLARKNLRVLCIDWDLEAPGLDRYFSGFERESATESGGLIGLLEKAASGHATPDSRPYLQRITCGGATAFDFLGSGDDSEDYGRRVADFSWPRFFAEQNGADFIEKLREHWCRLYDIVLLDSRTGVTDSGGVCTIQLPDLLVFLLAANRQNLDGFERIVGSIETARAALPYDRGRLRVLPVLSRLDGRLESDLSKQWLHLSAQELRPTLEAWLPRAMQAQTFLEKTKLAHIPYYSFGESLAVLRDSETDPEQLPITYRLLTELIADGLRQPGRVLGLQPDVMTEFGGRGDFLTMSVKQLDEIFSSSPAGPIPTGECEGTAIIAPGTQISDEIAYVVNTFSWKGKVFDAATGELRNKILPLGHKAIVATIYKGASWLDRKECIVLDYSQTSLATNWVRDEIREVSPGLYLGIVYFGKKKLIHFVLSQKVEKSGVAQKVAEFVKKSAAAGSTT